MEEGRIVDGRYVLLRCIGQGGFGEVHEARDEKTGQHIALKLLHLKHARIEAMRARFDREAKILMTMKSPHVARVLGAGIDEDTVVPYVALELLHGENLETLLSANGPLPFDVALRVAGQACHGLAAAHAAGIVHRDIKPSNLFLATSEDGTVDVKLVDFGVAKVIEQAMIGDDGKLTQTGELVGSPGYMSPEQIGEPRRVDQRTDLWSLGVVLFQMLSGRLPTEGNDGLMNRFRAIVDKPAPSVQDFAPWVPPDVADLVAHALTREISARFGSASEMHEAIGELLTGGTAISRSMFVPVSITTQGRREPRSDRHRLIDATQATMVAPHEAPRPVLAWIAVALVAALLAVVVTLATRLRARRDLTSADPRATSEVAASPSFSAALPTIATHDAPTAAAEAPKSASPPLVAPLPASPPSAASTSSAPRARPTAPHPRGLGTADHF